MSARAPFVPQRPASRTAEPKAAAVPVKSPPAGGHEHFRPNGLLDPPTGPPGDARNHSENPLASSGNSDLSSAQVFAANFRPLNVSGLGKKKSDTTSSGKSRQSVDNSAPGLKAFAPAQQARLGNPRPPSPFFQSSGPPAMNTFKAPAAPAQTSGQNDEFSANKAHTATSAKPPAFDTHLEMQGKPMSGPPPDQFRFSHGLDASYHSLRSRTASQPSLASIHEVAEEEEHTSSRKVPSVNGYSEYAGYADDSGFSDGDDGHYQQGLRRSAKRPDRTDEDEDEYEYGTGAKRYKTAPQNDPSGTYNGRGTPARYPGGDFDRAVTPAHGVPLLAPPAHFQPEPPKSMIDQSDGRQALYRLLGQDLETFVEGHADAYEQARRKWADCSVEEWSKGADELGGRFGKMLDYVKDHMTSKLSLYATLHTSITEHKKVLSEREETLKGARESLVREGGAVVGGPPKVDAGNDEEKDG
ncbi:uncharacterized protein TRAVEDRAFT_60994 [Trametes versicolor FP-101664 SS1]|uniref:uncharacterized protein n=1 Tax=Trametes versicolor (strain FP-101664) TaxID=717944 RepID=UPI00046232F9|nr:uncharacterized protein TRAVEDRAFT_60994 [Trametes versicolor FP-101664 SS1]EIW53767.1 hypothetical protein TRAVEDRAFT_60994 [Trametes versicolor FP-101664 SS1]